MCKINNQYIVKCKMRKIANNLQRELDSYIQAGYPREKAIQTIQSRRGGKLLPQFCKIAPTMPAQL